MGKGMFRSDAVTSSVGIHMGTFIWYLGIWVLGIWYWVFGIGYYWVLFRV